MLLNSAPPQGDPAPLDLTHSRPFATAGADLLALQSHRVDLALPTADIDIDRLSLDMQSAGQSYEIFLGSGANAILLEGGGSDLPSDGSGHDHLVGEGENGMLVGDQGGDPLLGQAALPFGQSDQSNKVETCEPNSDCESKSPAQASSPSRTGNQDSKVEICGSNGDCEPASPVQVSSAFGTGGTGGDDDHGQKCNKPEADCG